MLLETDDRVKGPDADEIMKEIERDINMKAEIPVTVFAGVPNGCLQLPTVPHIRFIKVLGSGCFGKLSRLT